MNLLSIKHALENRIYLAKTFRNPGATEPRATYWNGFYDGIFAAIELIGSLIQKEER